MRLATSLTLAALLLVGVGCSEPQEQNETTAPIKITPVEVVPEETPTPAVTSTEPQAQAQVTTTPADTKPITKPVVSGPVSYTMAEVKANNTPAKCWSVVKGKVYDLSSWISKHPGGSGAITRMCGIDATDAFTGKHGGQARPESELTNYFIGVLK